MTVLPVITRELRAQARSHFTYLMRVVAAAALLLVFLLFWLRLGYSQHVGGRLFGYLNCMLLAAIWILVPLISADCISQERREGTIGLLFLTPLRAREIVLAKGMVHGLRALSLWLAALPVMTICFLVGGVSWKEVALAVLIHFSSICWALAAGLVGSSATKPWLRAMLMAAGVAASFATLFDFMTGWGMVQAIAHDPAFKLPFPFQGWDWREQSFFPSMLGLGVAGISDFEGWWGPMFGSLTKQSRHAWLLTDIVLAAFSFLMLIGIVLGAAWNLRRVWQEEPPGARQLWLEEKLTKPVIGVNFFRRWLRRKLERNPIGWLEERTWSGRLATWGWFAVMVSFYSAFFQAPNRAVLAGVQTMMVWMLLGIMSASSAGSFQRERETRVLEVLLVSPMSASQIIYGRLRGLWGQFLPSLGLLMLVWIYFAGVFWERGDFRSMPFYCTAFATVPIIGLYYSLRRKQFITAFLSTLMTGLFLPWIIKLLATFFVEIVLGFGMVSLAAGGAVLGENSVADQIFAALRKTVLSPFFIVIIQASIALHVGKRLHHDLVHREFAFSKTD